MRKKSPSIERKIAIVGCYPETWERAPFDDPTWEIWGFSRRQMGKLPRCDKWFELHSPNKFPEYDSVIPGYSKWLSVQPNFLQSDLPKDDLVKKFGPFFFDGGQASWMLAYAITLKPSVIGIWGVECIDKYDKHRMAVQHFIQVAKDHKIKIVIPTGCTLLEARPFYGFPRVV